MHRSPPSAAAQPAPAPGAISCTGAQHGGVVAAPGAVAALLPTMPKAHREEEGKDEEQVPLLSGYSLNPGAPKPEHVQVQSVQATAAFERAAEERECFFDNAKGLTVFVVILSHTCMNYVNLMEIAALRPCFIMGALVAMPAFSFISGHLSSSELTHRRKLGVAKMLVVFVTYQLLYFFAQQIDVRLPRTAWDPGGRMARKKQAFPLPIWGQENVSWFLLCLIVWRVVLPLWARIHRPVTAAVLVSCVSILFDQGSNFMPIFGFFPFFIIGHTYSRADIWALRTWSNAVYYFIAPFVLLTIFSIIGSAQIDSLAAGHKNSPKDMVGQIIGPDLLFVVPSGVVMGGFGCLYTDQVSGGNVAAHRRLAPDGSDGQGCFSIGFPLRPLFYLLAFCAIRGWLALIPRAKTKFLTHAGTFSLYGYLLHPFFIWYNPYIWEAIHFIAMKLSGQPLEDQVTSYVGVLVVLVFVIALWLMLSNVCARNVCMICTEPAIDCLFLDEEMPTPTLNRETGAQQLRDCEPVCCSRCACCHENSKQRSKAFHAVVALACMILLGALLALTYAAKRHTGHDAEATSSQSGSEAMVL
eukprot:SAG31_NODE_78_length_27447_cov_83.819877_4_plen_582_part_00